ncbi:unnamed protein product, partial [Amoebophrya sp. A25]|eukprot:GSA25T00006381001.1
MYRNTLTRIREDLRDPEKKILSGKGLVEYHKALRQKTVGHYGESDLIRIFQRLQHGLLQPRGRVVLSPERMNQGKMNNNKTSNVSPSRGSRGGDDKTIVKTDATTSTSVASINITATMRNNPRIFKMRKSAFAKTETERKMTALVGLSTKQAPSGHHLGVNHCGATSVDQQPSTSRLPASGTLGSPMRKRNELLSPLVVSPTKANMAS